MARAILLAPETQQVLDQDKEYCVEFWVSANPQYDEREGERFADVLRSAGVCLRADGRNGLTQSFLAGERGRQVILTLRAPRPGRCRVAFLVGGELGPVRIADLRLREGGAEVFVRRFEHGLALANGSALSTYTFDMVQTGSGQKYRRFHGAQSPDINNGLPAGPRVTIPPQDGLLLKAE